MTEQPKKTVEDLTIPAEFNKIINDEAYNNFFFISDL